MEAPRGISPEPDATHIVKYERKHTAGTRSLEGRVVCKLTADNYGREWWTMSDNCTLSLL